MITDKQEKTYTSCSGPSCSEHKVRTTSKFCSHCGAKVINQTHSIVAERWFDVHRFMSQLEEEGVSNANGELVEEWYFTVHDSNYTPALYNDNHIVLLTYDGSSDDDIDSGDDITSLINVKPQEILGRFQRLHEPILERFKEELGADNVSVDFGLFNYWS